MLSIALKKFFILKAYLNKTEICLTVKFYIKKRNREQIYTEYAKSTTNVEKMVQSIIKGTLCL